MHAHPLRVTEELQIHTIDTSDIADLDHAFAKPVHALHNTALMNDVRRINRFLIAVNAGLPAGGIYVCVAETIVQRKRRMRARFGFWFKLVYALDFLFSRVLPKLPGLQKLYFGVTGGRNRAISLPEMLGRLSYCGFEIREFAELDGRTRFVVRKKTTPLQDPSPSYGPLIRMRRIGQGGRIFPVYKFRTMHPYAEYIQEYVYERNSVARGGKFNDDFRITNWGAIMRKTWLDELPMIANFLRGQMKLVGVRPLSAHYFGLYPPHLQDMRTRVKPGLVPPFYADMPDTLSEIFRSEERYLRAYAKHPHLTDLRYFGRACYNIFIRRMRSA